MDRIIDLRTPSYIYNHGGYYAPVDPRDCNMPNGPCSYCQERIDEEEADQEAAKTLLALAQSQPACCAERPGFLEPCPNCHAVGAYVTHTSRGIRTCNGCGDKLCINCFFGARYYCPLRRQEVPPLSPPHGPLQRQEALGVQSPKVEEKRENK